MGRASGGASSGGFSGTRVSDGELDSLDRIEGVDFGFGGTAAVVSAAVRMNRLDLLDRLYERGETGSRLLLCLTACRAAVYGVAPNH